MELYGFGFNGCAQIDPGEETNVVIPKCIRRAKEIRLLWVSWCDALAALRDGDGDWEIEYFGTGLTGAQKEYVQNCKKITTALREDRELVHFFGTAMQDGLRGYITYHAELYRNEVVLLATDLEMESGTQEVQTYPLEGEFAIQKIEVMSSGRVLACTVSRTIDPKHQCIQLESISDLRQYCIPNNIIQTQEVSTDLDLDVLTSNSTTAIALDPDGTVFTYTSDPRYPQSLGRPYDGQPDFAPIDYLTEMRMSKIASGGYMSAATSSDGELYLWGLACPDSAGELAALKREREIEGGDLKRPSRITAWRGDEPEYEDDYVNCLLAVVDEEPARVYDVAIGHGHVLVAARSSNSGGKSVVFVAGDGSKGQLGIERGGFAAKFKEVETIGDKEVVQMAAAGWTSFIVTKKSD